MSYFPKAIKRKITRRTDVGFFDSRVLKYSHFLPPIALSDSRLPMTIEPARRYLTEMIETDIDELRIAVERMHGGSATLTQTVPVRETFDGKTVWEGLVHVFDLTGHPTAPRAYAWSSPIEGSSKRRFVAVLHTERINSPLEAVRTAIVAEYRGARHGDT